MSTAPPTPAPASTRSRAAQIARPARLAGAAAQLAAVAVAWSIAFSILSALLASGLALLPVVGLGLPVLLVLVYALYGFGWLETARVDGLYRLGLPALAPRRMQRPGFVGFLHVLWRQTIDGRMWRAVAMAAVSTILGWVVLAALTSAASATALAFGPLYAPAGTSLPLVGIGWQVPVDIAPITGAVVAVVALALIAALALLHGRLAQAILTPSRTAVLAEQARASQEQRAGAVRAADLDRTRIERDLHDGVQPRLVSVGMTLGMAQQKIDSDPESAKALIAEAHTSTKAAITELRQLARGIHTSVLDDRGLDAALSALASRSPVPVTLDVRITGRCSRPAETAVYFVIAESLTNAAKHARAAACRVQVRLREDATLWARIEDDGVGGARIAPGGGLDGLNSRVLGVGGTFRLDSPAGGPTAVEVTVPCAS